MIKRNGLWVCLEGSDYTGKKTQSILLAQRLLDLSEDNDVLLTHEPTRRAKEIKRKLKEEKDAYDGQEEMARLYIEDRVRHEREIILPALERGQIVIANRGNYSTDAYQSAQGGSLDNLINLQKQAGIQTPDIIFFIEISGEELQRRIYLKTEKNPDKFEKNKEFQEEVKSEYRKIFGMKNSDFDYFGNIYLISGEGNPEDVSKRIIDKIKSDCESYLN
jgi:dTMP kinase